MLDLAVGPVIIAVENASAAPHDDADLLSVSERHRQATMPARRAAEFTRGRSLLRRLAGLVLGIPPRDLCLWVEPKGRPRMSPGPAGVSLSHTQAHTAAAIWLDGEVGIDVEEPPASVSDGLVQRCAGPWSADVLALPLGERAAVFAGIWATQEACVKAVGAGLAAAPWTIPVPPRARSGHWHDVTWRAIPEFYPTAVVVAGRRHQHHEAQRYAL